MLLDIPLYNWPGSRTKITPDYVELARERLHQSGFEVSLQAGYARVSHPDRGFEVSIVFSGDAKTIGELTQTIDEVTISGEIPGTIDLTPFVAALVDKLIGEPASASDQVPTGRPQPGRPADKAFYRDLVALATRLRVQGDSHPAATIAEWMSTEEEDVWPEQVRTWLHRAQGYLREEG